MKMKFFYYNLFTKSLNFCPLSAKFLNISKEAEAGENNTTSPTLATSLAFATTSSKVFKMYISIFSFVLALITAL